MLLYYNEVLYSTDKIKKIYYELSREKSVNPHTPDRFTSSHTRYAENCGLALTHP